MIRILHGDCREVMRGLPAESVDSVVSDPPYELGFMGKGWDKSGVANDPDVWREALRLLKPGGYLLAFSSTRTYHRMVCAIEDAGFEIRDQIGWAFGSGFPKSMDVSKAIDKHLGAKREITRAAARPLESGNVIGFDQRASSERERREIPATATATATAWKGYGTALKPAWEPVVLARKPLPGTVAANVLQHGTGALNIDGCRVEFASQDDQAAAAAAAAAEQRSRQSQRNTDGWGMKPQDLKAEDWNTEGRWPANLIHDGSAEVIGLFPFTESGKQASGGHVRNSDKTRNAYGAFEGQRCEGDVLYGDAGSAARFFYCAKADKSDRNEGLEGLEGRVTDDGREVPADNAFQRGKTLRKNHHPTVKPTDLMRYLCRLITPPGGMVLDPFMGSGSTLKAAELEGFSAIGIELDAEYIEIARLRIASDTPLFANVEVVRDDA